jgi:oligoribonuclease NrnB/cAMP/cGMP phosphodiesterase (DHH superfamily)
MNDLAFRKDRQVRIVTRPDFDGVVCAMLLSQAESIDQAIKWVEPAEIQHARTAIHAGDILANLPYDRRCTLWFDHHFSNQIDQHFSGAYTLAPSAARVIFDYNRDRFSRDFGELIGKYPK